MIRALESHRKPLGPPCSASGTLNGYPIFNISGRWGAAHADPVDTAPYPYKPPAVPTEAAHSAPQLPAEYAIPAAKTGPNPP